MDEGSHVCGNIATPADNQGEKLPETAPSYVMLTKVLQIRRLLDKSVDLSKHIKLFVWFEVSPGELFLDAREHLKGPRILNFLCFSLICGRDA